MAVRTKQLAGASFTSGTGDVLVYTCPAAETAIVKSLAVWSQGGGITYTWKLRPDAVTGAFPVLSVVPAANIPEYRDVWLVMLPGNRLELQRSGASAGSVVVSGTELEGLAD